MNELKKQLGNSLIAQQIRALKENFKSLSRKRSSTNLSIEKHSRENSHARFDKSGPAVGQNGPHVRQICAGLATVLSGTFTFETGSSTLGRKETKEQSNKFKLTVAGTMDSKQRYETQNYMYHTK